MKKYSIFLLSVFLLMVGYINVSAQNISTDSRLYISKPVIYDGMVSEGNRLPALAYHQNYDTVQVSISVEQMDMEPLRENVTVSGAVFEDGQLTALAAEKKMLGESITDFLLEFHDIYPSASGFEMKIFVWNEDMQPYIDSWRIEAQHDPLPVEMADMDIIRARIEKDAGLYSTAANPSSLLAKLNSDGKFNDIDYGYTSEKSTWEPSQVFKNVIVMAQAYFSEGNSWYHNKSLKAAIDSVLNDWVKNQYTSVNWWFNEIDVPKSLSQLLLYPFDENEPYLPVLKELAMKGMPKMDESKPHKSSDTGGNLTDKLQTAIKIAAAARDVDSMKNIVSYLLDNELSVFDHANGGEGIMTDYTLHQHGSFFYNGSYGSVFCSGINMLLEYLEDTCFMVSDRALNTYADFILDGHSWFFKNNGSDFACFGRAISRNNGVGGSIKNNSLEAVNILQKLPRVERRAELLHLKDTRLGSADNSTYAAKHFYISDMTVMHRPDFYVGVRNSSSRNINTEYMNGENKRAVFISDGATVIMKTGNEYRNIFPVWDWSRIPGTTTEYIQNPTLTGTYQYGTRNFVGGVSDGLNAVSVMDYGRRGVTAKKAVFMFDQGFTSLGAGITGTSSGVEVDTTMNQCIQNGTVTYFNGTEGKTSETSGLQVQNAQWVHHDNVGYYFPETETVTIKAEQRSGNWKDINTSQSSSTVSNRIFALYTSHGTRPSDDTYAYTVLPSATVGELEAYTHNPDMEIIENTSKVQAVWSHQVQSAGIVFWNQGVSSYQERVTLPKAVTGLEEDLVIEALEDPCVVLLNCTEDGFDLFISNPKNDGLAQTQIGINRQLTGDHVQWLEEEQKSVITLDFPQGNERGAAVKLSFYEVK